MGKTIDFKDPHKKNVLVNICFKEVGRDIFFNPETEKAAYRDVGDKDDVILVKILISYHVDKCDAGWQRDCLQVAPSKGGGRNAYHRS